MVRIIKYRDSTSIAILFHDTYCGIKFLVSPNTTLGCAKFHYNHTNKSPLWGKITT